MNAAHTSLRLSSVFVLAACTTDYVPVCTAPETAEGWCSCLSRPDDETNEVTCEATDLTFCCQSDEFLTEENVGCSCVSPWKCTGVDGLCGCTLGRVPIAPEVEVESCDPASFPGKCCFDPSTVELATYELVCVCGREACLDGQVEVTSCAFEFIVDDLAQPHCDTLGGAQRVDSCSG